MSTRERWIVYPLLFLALGMVFRERLTRQFHATAGEIAAQRVRCEELLVDRLLCDRAEVRRNAQCGQAICRALVVEGPNGRPVVVAGTDTRNEAGIVEVFGAKGPATVRLQSTPTGGLVTAINDLQIAVAMGWIGRAFGVFAGSPEQGRLIPLTKPGRLEAIAPPESVPKAKPSPSKRSDAKPTSDKEDGKTKEPAKPKSPDAAPKSTGPA